MSENERNHQKNSRNRNRWIGVGTILMITVLFILLRSCQHDSDPEDKKKPVPLPGGGEVLDGDLPHMSDEAIRDYLIQKQDASMFTVTVNSEASIQKGSKTLQLMVANPKRNSLECYVEVIHDGETLYTSPLMKPKQYIQKAELSKPLEGGKNKLIVRYNIVHQGEIVGVQETEIMAVTKS
ncbi:hypothetical protein [Paenibacillus sp. GYB003]|uniref:hypothetical protein n=1 Tax=Paenibacillus sp. GYB003 TaxID=2994392 RepID=UPI002F96931D